MNIRPQIILVLGCVLMLPFASARGADLGAESPRKSTPLVQWQFVEDTEADVPATHPPKTAEWKQVAVPHVFRQAGLPDDTAGWYRQSITTD